MHKGEWKDGRANGYGIQRRSDGSVRHDGLWENDKPVLVEPDSIAGKERHSLPSTR